MTQYVPVPPGPELFDGTMVNVVASAINAALVAGSITSVAQIPMLQPGFRLVSGDHLINMGLALTALGHANPVPVGQQGGPRLHSGSVLNSMASQMSLY